MTPIRFLRLNLKEENDVVLFPQRKSHSAPIFGKYSSLLSLLLLWQDWTFFSIFLISIFGWWELEVVFVELVVIFTQRQTLQLKESEDAEASLVVSFESLTQLSLLDSHLVTCLVLLDKSLWLWSEVLIISHKTQDQLWTLSWQYSHQSEKGEILSNYLVSTFK